jgi:hypothetical protein
MSPIPTPRHAVPCRNLIASAVQPPCCTLDHAVSDCPACPDNHAGLNISERTRCEVWTRVMGYHRPVSQWNLGKQAEHRERVVFKEPRDRGDL